MKALYLKAYIAARNVLARACEAKASRFELVRLGKVFEKARREYSDLFASITGFGPIGRSIVVKGKSTPPRDPNDDEEEEDSDAESDEEEPAVIREPDE